MTAIQEARAEFFRTFVLGLIPALLLIIGVISSGIDTSTGEIMIRWGVILAVSLMQLLTILSTALASGLDKYKHVQNKKLDPKFSVLSKGLVNF